MPPDFPTHFQDRLLRIAAACDSELHLFDAIIDAIKEEMGSTGADLFLRGSGDELVMRASTYTPELTSICRLGKGVGVCGRALSTGEPVFVPNRAAEHPDNITYPGVDDTYISALAALPIPSAASAQGVLLLFWDHEIEMSPTFRKGAQHLALATGQVLELCEKMIRIGAHSNRLDAVSQVSQKIASVPYLEEVLQLLVHMTAQQFGYTVCTVRLLDEHTDELVLRATQASARAYQRKRAIRSGESIAGRAISTNRPVIVRDVLVDPEYIGHDLAAEQGLRSMICIPLTMHDRPLGVLSCYTNEVREFSQDEIEALETIVQQAAFAIERAGIQVRTTLLQEMNHRVKNNLQQVASLLRLQMRHGSYKNLEEALQECISRVAAISAVHGILSREDLDHVGMRTLAETLVHLQCESMLRPDIVIEYQVRGDDFVLGTQQATQVALILNELLQNAHEHSFVTARNGQIHITTENVNGMIGIWVSSLGDPLPSNFDWEQSSGLGLTIVNSLVKNMGGSFALENRLGWTIAEFRFQALSSD